MTFPLPGANWSYLHSLTLKASAGASGFPLANGTPGILTWTAPADGNEHRVLLFFSVHITSSQTGGQVTVNATAPDGTNATWILLAGGAAAGSPRSYCEAYVIESGSTITVAQSTALTAGAATLWAEIWGS